MENKTQEHNVQHQNKFYYKAALFLSFAGPSVFLFAAVVIAPFIFGIYLTFTDWNGISSTMSFSGKANYVALFRDTAFWMSMGKTIFYTFFSVVLANAVAFFLAYLVTSHVIGKDFFRAVFFTPNLIGGIVLGYIWKFVFNKAVLTIGKMTGMPLFSSAWLSDPDKALWALILVSVWQLSGFLMLIYIAGLTGIPDDLKSAALIDGCNGWQSMKNVTIPLMAGTFTICFFLSITRCFVTYDLNLSLTAGQPYNSTKLAAMYVYNMAFESKNYGLGQAEALILFLFVSVVAVTQVLLGKQKEVEA